MGIFPLPTQHSLAAVCRGYASTNSKIEYVPNRITVELKISYCRIASPIAHDLLSCSLVERFPRPNLITFFLGKSFSSSKKISKKVRFPIRWIMFVHGKSSTVSRRLWRWKRPQGVQSLAVWVSGKQHKVMMLFFRWPKKDSVRIIQNQYCRRI